MEELIILTSSQGSVENKPKTGYGPVTDHFKWLYVYYCSVFTIQNASINAGIYEWHSELCSQSVISEGVPASMYLFP